MDTASERASTPDAGDPAWTARQKEVLDLIARGKTNQEVAETLGISLDGAKWHMREILSKLGVDTREEAAEYWRRRNGWPARLSRLLRLVIGGATVKVVATSVAAAAVLGCAAVVAAVLAPNGDDDSPSNAAPAALTPSTTPIPATATPDPASRWQAAAPGPCPLPTQEPCDTAVALAAAVRSGDMAEVFALGAPLTVICPANDEQECGAAGQTREVFAAGKWGGHAGIDSQEQLEVFLTGSMADRGPVHVAAVGCLADETLPTHELCREFSVALVLTHPDADQILRFAFRQLPEGGAGFYGVMNWVPWDEDLRTGTPTFAAFGLRPGFYTVPKVSFMPWTPP